jgi:hypothetical protein
MKLFLKRLLCKNLFIDSNKIGYQVCVKCYKYKLKNENKI